MAKQDDYLGTAGASLTDWIAGSVPLRGDGYSGFRREINASKMSPDQFVDAISEYHAEVRRYAAITIDRAIKLGICLLELKARVPHGEFGKYRDRVSGLSSSQAAKYMLIARNVEVIARVSSNDCETPMTIGRALRMIDESNESERRSPREIESENLASRFEDPSPEFEQTASANEAVDVDDEVEEVELADTQNATNKKARSVRVVGCEDARASRQQEIHQVSDEQSRWEEFGNHLASARSMMGEFAVRFIRESPSGTFFSGLATSDGGLCMASILVRPSGKVFANSPLWRVATHLCWQRETICEMDHETSESGIIALFGQLQFRALDVCFTAANSIPIAREDMDRTQECFRVEVPTGSLSEYRSPRSWFDHLLIGDSDDVIQGRVPYFARKLPD